MKTAARYNYYANHAPKARRYPNAASARYFVGRILDGLLAAGITVAVVAIFLFLVVLAA